MTKVWIIITKEPNKPQEWEMISASEDGLTQVLQMKPAPAINIVKEVTAVGGVPLDGKAFKGHKKR